MLIKYYHVTMMTIIVLAIYFSWISVEKTLDFKRPFLYLLSNLLLFFNVGLLFVNLSQVIK